MRRAPLPHERIDKQEWDEEGLAEAFLLRNPLPEKPKWYRDLLSEHRAEIAAVLAAWLIWLRGRLAHLALEDWFLLEFWLAAEARLAERLAPVLRRAIVAAANRQALMRDEPIPNRFLIFEAAGWAGAEAVRQARWIAQGARESLETVLPALQRRGVRGAKKTILEAGVFGLNRRFAGFLERFIDSSEFAPDTLHERAEKLFRVRQEYVVGYNGVNAVNEGLFMAALFWERAGRVVTKTWITMRDERVCPTCRSLDLQEVPLRSSFVAASGRAFVHPPAHPLCRCFTRVGIRENIGVSGLVA